MTLSEIIERVEAATGPDRELDGAIYIAMWIKPEEAGRVDHRGGTVGWWPKSGPYRGAIEVLPYTTSLDVAMTLVPPGHAISLHVDADGTVHAGCMLDDGDGCSDAEQCGATPALALTAAALRARLAMEKSA